MTISYVDRLFLDGTGISEAHNPEFLVKTDEIVDGINTNAVDIAAFDQSVPTPDSPDNLDIADVTGNKLDTVAGNSIISLVKQALAQGSSLHALPLVDAITNVYIRDAVGNKGDTVAGTSLIARVKAALAALALPGADSANNITIADVGGNKLDTVAGTSLIALAKQALAALGIIDAFHDVPATNSADNITMRDAVGSKLDRSYLGSMSISGIIHTLEDHAHSASWVLPNRASSIQATAGTGWAYGVASAPLGTPADIFDGHWLEIVADTNAEYQGAVLVDGVQVTEFDFERIAASTRSFSKFIQMVPAAAGPITIKLASSTNGATAWFKINGHNY